MAVRCWTYLHYLEVVIEKSWRDAKGRTEVTPNPRNHQYLVTHHLAADEKEGRGMQDRLHV